MEIQKLSNQHIKNKKLPAQAVIIQLLDKDKQHLAFVVYQYPHEFQYWNYSDGYEESRFNEELSDIENEMLNTCFEMDNDLAERFGGSTGGLIITDENSKVILQERPTPLLS